MRIVAFAAMLLVMAAPVKSEPLTLNKAIDAEIARLGWDDPGWRENSIDLNTCTVLKRADLRCSFNTLTTLSIFLTLNGKGMFPPGKGTNSFDGFTGTRAQIKLLTKALAVNQRVFTWGELTGEDVTSKWKMVTPDLVTAPKAASKVQPKPAPKKVQKNLP